MSNSGSSDGSTSRAARLGFPVLELDPGRPFSAARARNEGLEEALKRWPEIRYVLFLDGDCMLDPGFPTAAAMTFDAHPECAIVTGHLSEQFPEASVYNRLCAIEWRSPAGRIENFAALGGIMTARASAVRAVGGFNEQVIAGEDSELGVRLALANHSVIKIDQPMAVHDARMMTFGQWWKRSVRAGHALAQRYALNGRSRLHDCRRELVSTLLWGLIVPWPRSCCCGQRMACRCFSSADMPCSAGGFTATTAVPAFLPQIRSSPRSSCFTPSSRTWSAFSAFRGIGCGDDSGSSNISENHG